jgi:uracil-DNA glycosylase
MEYLYDSDILEVDAQIIAQQCNCVSKTGKGLSLDISEKFQYADFYSKRGKPSVPGTIEVRGGKGLRWVCGMYAQYYPGGPRDGDTLEQRVKWFEECLGKIGKIKNLRHIAFPDQIGCGLACGDWPTYYAMLYRFSEQHPKVRVTIVSKGSPPDEIEDKCLYDDEGLCGCIKEDIKHNQQGQIYQYDEDGTQIDCWSDAETFQKMTGYVPYLPEVTYATTTLVEYTQTHLPSGWEDFFTEQLDSEMGTLPEISTYLEKEAKTEQIFPPLEMIYTSFELLRPEDILVVVIGQDPYHDDGQAMGVSFSVPEGVYPPPSLKNIYKEAESTGITISNPDHGDLSEWCRRGVFLINTALTVRAHTPKSHSKRWVEMFTPALFRWMNDRCDPMVIIMWGNDAQALGRYFGDKHRKIISAHPSPLSASRGFFGSNPFNRANKCLKELGRSQVDWSL